MKVRKIEKKDFNPWEESKGTYAISGKGIMIILPCGDFFNDFEGKWKYTNIENQQKITLSPSIFCSPEKPCWHGFLTNGELKL